MVLLFSLTCHKIIAKEKKYTSESMIGKWMAGDIGVLQFIAPDKKIKLAFPMSKKSFENYYGARPAKFLFPTVPYLQASSWAQFASASKDSTNDLIEIIVNLNARVDKLEGRIADLEEKRR